MDLSQAYILFVDDDRLQRKLFPEILDPVGAQILTAANAENALDIISDRRPDLILCDAVMPAVDGFQFCRQIKQDPATREIPFAILTSLSQNVGERSLQVGADDYFLKKGSEDLLRLRVRMLLDIATRGADVAEPLESFAGCRVVAASASALLLSQLSLQLTPTGLRVETCSTPGEVLDLLGGPPPSLLVLDATMTSGNLKDLARSLRSEKAWEHVPILVVVDKGEEPTVDAGDLLIHDWVTKPLDGREAKRRISMSLRYGRAMGL